MKAYLTLGDDTIFIVRLLVQILIPQTNCILNP